MTIAGLDLYALIMLLYFVAVVPLLARREMATLNRDIAQGKPDARVRVYRWTMAFQWGVTGVLVAGWLMLDRSLTSMGLELAADRWQWLAIGVASALILVFAIVTIRDSRDPDKLAEVRTQLGPLLVVTPHSVNELRHFIWVSITAGICEEILYRGLLMTALGMAFGLWPAVIVSSVVFGLGHMYQGVGGVVRTGLVGLVMALVVVFTGSLFTAMVMHAVMDIVQGRMLWAAVNAEVDGAA